MGKRANARKILLTPLLFLTAAFISCLVFFTWYENGIREQIYRHTAQVDINYFLRTTTHVMQEDLILLNKDVLDGTTFIQFINSLAYKKHSSLTYLLINSSNEVVYNTNPEKIISTDIVNSAVFELQNSKQYITTQYLKDFDTLYLVSSMPVKFNSNEFVISSVLRVDSSFIDKAIKWPTKSFSIGPPSSKEDLSIPILDSNDKILSYINITLDPYDAVIDEMIKNKFLFAIYAYLIMVVFYCAIQFLAVRTTCSECMEIRDLEKDN